VQGKHNTMIKRIVDACMTVLLLCQMAYQVTGEVLHEWIGMGMTALVVIHQILNRKWYCAIFKGKYNPSPVEPYSADYNTVLMEAQEDQHNQARPELAGHVENMDDYDTILLGYPNWWASIPMPIASFLEEYDFSGKRIIPFCSHGGGRFGQSLTAIAKLSPDANMGEGLSVHYSGGATLSEDIQKWLDVNGINK